MSSVWPNVQLGALLTDIQPGFASGRHNSDGVGIPHFRPMNVSTDGKILRSVMKYVDPDTGRADVRLRRGDILFNNTNSPELVGKTAYFEGDDSPAFSNHMTRLRVDESKLDARFAALNLHQAWREGWFAAHCNNHVSQASIGREVLKAFELKLPPLDVQREIASLSVAVDDSKSSASTHLVAARRAIDRLRQSVLAAACSGRLTDDWRNENQLNEPADALVARIDDLRRTRLVSRYKAPMSVEGFIELPEGWCWTTVGALVDVATGATPLRKQKDYYGGATPWVTSGAVNAGYITSAIEYITDKAIQETNAKVFPAGTLLVAMYGEGQTRGRVAELAIDAATNQAVAALLFDESTACLRPYLKVFFLENYERIRALSFGGVQPNLSLGSIRDTVLPLPPLSEQVEIVNRVERLLATSANLRGRIDVASRLVDRSSQAVLAKAFRGELHSASQGIGD